MDEKNSPFPLASPQMIEWYRRAHTRISENRLLSEADRMAEYINAQYSVRAVSELVHAYTAAPMVDISCQIEDLTKCPWLTDHYLFLKCTNAQTLIMVQRIYRETNTDIAARHYLALVELFRHKELQCGFIYVNLAEQYHPPKRGSQLATPKLANVVADIERASWWLARPSLTEQQCVAHDKPLTQTIRVAYICASINRYRMPTILVDSLQFDCHETLFDVDVVFVAG